MSNIQSRLGHFAPKAYDNVSSGGLASGAAGVIGVSGVAHPSSHSYEGSGASLQPDASLYASWRWESSHVSSRLTRFRSGTGSYSVMCCLEAFVSLTSCWSLPAAFAACEASVNSGTIDIVMKQ
ncbi:hypothetical protein B0H13DRAFT_1897254 [Mycena leptocephala]|nr:hypothetical protein B0H13DRAFT_1897254 [Mycena leptocephala]